MNSLLLSTNLHKRYTIIVGKNTVRPGHISQTRADLVSLITPKPSTLPTPEYVVVELLLQPPSLKIVTIQFTGWYLAPSHSMTHWEDKISIDVLAQRTSTNNVPIAKRSHKMRRHCNLFDSKINIYSGDIYNNQSLYVFPKDRAISTTLSIMPREPESGYQGHLIVNCRLFSN